MQRQIDIMSKFYCEGCIHFVPNVDGKTGECRKKPPVVVDAKEMAVYPKVNRQWYCGVGKIRFNR